MKLVAKKPIYLRGEVVLAEKSFDTDEQHGRELIKKGYAAQFVEPDVIDEAKAAAEAEAKAAAEAEASKKNKARP